MANTAASLGIHPRASASNTIWCASTGTDNRANGWLNGRGRTTLDLAKMGLRSQAKFCLRGVFWLAKRWSWPDALSRQDAFRDWRAMVPLFSIQLGAASRWTNWRDVARLPSRCVNAFALSGIRWLFITKLLIGGFCCWGQSTCHSVRSLETIWFDRQPSQPPDQGCLTAGHPGCQFPDC